MSLFEVHIRLANTALLYTIILALWAIWRFVRKQGIDSNYWGALAIAEILFIVHFAIGGYQYLVGAVPFTAGGMHILYGVVSVLVIPAVYLFTKGDDQRRASIVYGAALLFLMGVVIRGIATGQ